MNKNRLDLRGKKFNQLTAKEIHHCYPPAYNVYWTCVCECKEEVIVRAAALKNGKAKSCRKCYKERRQKEALLIGKIHVNYFYRVKSNAALRGMSFNLTPENMWEAFQKQNGKCILSGEELTFFTSTKKANIQTASLDRIDSSRGYEPDNIQWIHKDLNIMKNNHEEVEFIKWCKKVSEHQESKALDIKEVKSNEPIDSDQMPCCSPTR